jgi:hypothetical protein
MIRDRLGMELSVFVKERKLGLVAWETESCSFALDTRQEPL